MVADLSKQKVELDGSLVGVQYICHKGTFLWLLSCYLQYVTALNTKGGSVVAELNIKGLLRVTELLKRGYLVPGSVIVLMGLANIL